MAVCNCGPIGTYETAVILDLPDWVDPDKKVRSVSVDGCIVHVIKHLWANGIDTRGNCCGHRQANPSVIVDTKHYTGAELDRIFDVIAEVDDRCWELDVWELVRYTRHRNFLYKATPVNNAGKRGTW